MNALLPSLATKDEIATLDRCMGMLGTKVEDSERSLLAKLDELISKVDNLGHQGMSAIDIANEAKEIALGRTSHGTGGSGETGNGHEPSSTPEWPEEEDTKPDHLLHAVRNPVR